MWEWFIAGLGLWLAWAVAPFLLLAALVALGFSAIYIAAGVLYARDVVRTFKAGFQRGYRRAIGKGE